MLFSIRSAGLPPPTRDRSVQDPGSPLTETVGAETSLPRHLLVSLAGIAADVTSLRERSAEAPEVYAALGTILGRVDGLVDSIYEHAADPAVIHAAAATHGSDLAAGCSSDARADAPAGFADATDLTRSPARVGHARAGNPSYDTVVDQGRRQTWASVSE